MKTFETFRRFRACSLIVRKTYADDVTSVGGRQNWVAKCYDIGLFADDCKVELYFSDVIFECPIQSTFII